MCIGIRVPIKNASRPSLGPDLAWPEDGSVQTSGLMTCFLVKPSWEMDMLRFLECVVVVFQVSE